MTDAVVILCNCADLKEAEHIAVLLVEERLAACVNILPAIQSIYRWQGALERATEVPILIKTASRHFDAIRARIKELHSYAVPEILALPVVRIEKAYLDWLQQQL